MKCAQRAGCSALHVFLATAQRKGNWEHLAWVLLMVQASFPWLSLCSLCDEGGLWRDTKELKKGLGILHLMTCKLVGGKSSCDGGESAEGRETQGGIGYRG